eukprot:1401085-Rhodomonas_salina.2
MHTPLAKTWKRNDLCQRWAMHSKTERTEQGCYAGVPRLVLRQTSFAKKAAGLEGPHLLRSITEAFDDPRMPFAKDEHAVRSITLAISFACSATG